MDNATELPWNLYVELRKEILETQQLRARAIGFKITFVGGAIALILANRQTVDDRLIVIPAFAAMFFDLVINSYSIQIKRIAAYCRIYLEPELRRLAQWPESRLLWEEFMVKIARRQRLAMIGNLGITFLVALPGALLLLSQPPNWPAVLLFLALLITFVFVALSYLWLKRYVTMQSPADRK